MESNASGKRSEEEPGPRKSPRIQKTPGREQGIPGGESTISDPGQSSGSEFPDGPADPGREGNPREAPQGPSAGSELPMRLVAFIGICCLSGWAFAANVLLTKPAQGETILGENVLVAASVTEDFIVGKDGFIEIWVDGSRALTLTGKSGTLKLSPGNHQLQAHLVGPDHEALPIATNSEQVTVTVAQPDPRKP